MNDLVGFMHRRYKTLVALFLLWTVFAAADILSDWYSFTSTGRAFLMSRKLMQAAFIFYPWFGVSLLIGWVAWRYPPGTATWRGWVLHVLLASLIAMVHLGLVVASFWIFFPEWVANASAIKVFIEQFLKWFLYEHLAYFAVLFAWALALRQSREDDEQPAAPLQKLVGKAGGEVHVVRAEQVDWIAADDNYVVVHAGDRQVRVRETLKVLESVMDPRIFVRVHRSAIVNINRLRQIDGSSLVMVNGERAPCSRSGRRQLKLKLRGSQSPPGLA